MITVASCAACGAEVLPGAVDGQCAQCLILLGLNSTSEPAFPGDVDLGPILARPHAPLGVKFHRLGDYELIEEIARGGMGVVFRARQVSLNRPVALKLILGGRLASPAVARRFQVEAEAAASLHHSNIVAVYETGECDGHPFYSMELIEGAGLDRCAANYQLPRVESATSQARAEARSRQNSIAALMAAVARAVDYAHQRGVLHRDLKPGNVIVDLEGRPHLTDFGLAKLVGEEQTQFTLAGAILGTPNYMAPELASGHAHQATTAADVYSLGAILYELLAGAAPFHAETPVAIWRRALEEEARPPRALNPLVETELSTICLRCLEKQPERRYPSARALADDLERWLAGEPIAAHPVGPGERCWRWCRRQPALAAMALAAVLSLVGGLVGVSTQWHRAERGARLTLLNLYAADMDSAQHALKEGNFGRARQLLEAYRPAAGAEDLRGFEWRMLWHSAQGEHEVAFLGHSQVVHAVAFSPDNQWLASASADGSVRIWDYQQRTLNHTLAGHTGAVHAVAFSPDSRWLATASEDGTLKLWRTGSWQLSTQLMCRPPPFQVAFSPTESVLAYSEGGSVNVTAGRIRLWNYVTGTLLRTWSDVGNRLAFTPDGTGLITGNLERLALWDTATGRNLWKSALPFSALSIAVSPAGDRFAACSFQGQVRMFDLANPQRSWVLKGQSSRSRGVAFSPDGAYLASASGDQTVRLWNVSSWERTNLAPRTLRGHGSGVRCLAFSPKGGFLASGDKEGVLLLWSAQAHSPAAIVTNVLTSYTNAPPIFSQNSKWMAAVTAPDEVAIWDLPTMGRRQTFSGVRIPLAVVEDPPTFVSLSPVYAYQDWDMNSGVLRREVPLVRAAPAFTGKLSPNRKILAVGYLDGSFSLWDIESSKELWRQRGHRANVRELAFSPDGRYLATASQDATAKLWDLRAHRELATLAGHGDEVWTIAFAPDGATVITGSSDHTARLWEVPSGRQLTVLAGHKEGVFRATFAPDGRTLATASDDDTVRLWHFSTRREVATLEHGFNVVSVCFTPDGEFLVSSSQRGALHVFRAPDFATLDAAARRKTVRP